MKKKILISIGALVGVLAIYFGGIQYFLWQWETPRIEMPTSVYENNNQKTYLENYKPLTQSINEDMIKAAKSLGTTSITGAVSIDGNLVWAGSVGFANVENQTPTDTDKMYRIGSISKSLTSIALARMVEENMINLDADIHDYLPNYPIYETPLTVRQLASHMAGIRHYKFDITEYPPTDFFSTIHYNDVDDVLTTFKDDDLVFQPGLGFSYSTNGYTLLSAVMQAAGKKPYLTLMQDLVFTPLNMTRTKAEDQMGNLDGIVGFYNAGDGLFSPTHYVDLSNKWAGGGLVSTPSDLVKLGGALLTDEILKPETRDAFFTRQPMFDGADNPQAYALGWRHHQTINILGEDQKVDVVHHGGAGAGAMAFLLLVPEHNISVAFISNGVNDEVRPELQMMAYRAAATIINNNK